MSDFDKEAEREKLREKYERDQAEREATQRMSDLLLKGATMTNAHCGTCGDPLFQENGTTFCPSCHGNPDAVEGTNLEARPAGESSDNPDRPAADAGQSSTDTSGSEDSNTRPQEREQGSSANSATDPTTETEPTAASKDPQRPDSGRSAREAPNRSSAGEDRTDASLPARSQSAVDGDVEAARDSLVRALEKFAGEAAATDDPRYATECLEAAREASETLRTLR